MLVSVMRRRQAYPALLVSREQTSLYAIARGRVMDSETLSIAIIASIFAVLAAISYMLRTIADVRLRNTEHELIAAEYRQSLAKQKPPIAWTSSQFSIETNVPTANALEVENTQDAPQRWMLTDDGEIMEVVD